MPPSSIWCRSALSQVQLNLDSTGYPHGQIHHVVGDVQHDAVSGVWTTDVEVPPRGWTTMELIVG